MKSLITLTLLTILAAGCASNSSVEPRTVIRMDRSQTGGVAGLMQTNAPDHEPPDLGVAPPVSSIETSAMLANTNSLTGVNVPRLGAAPGAIGTSSPPLAVIAPIGGSLAARGVGTNSPPILTSPTAAGIVGSRSTSGTTASGPNSAVGGSPGTALGGTGTGTGSSSTFRGLTNDLIGTNLFGPRP